ncbi:RraA family protein [Aquabacter sp. CN5-332]|uniref:RraA family protein n=1 Tax=Aquabacter sp. CN5-332 TaxID=3156608 RepID=UPI0032B3AD05
MSSHRLPNLDAVISGFLSLPDLTGTASDAMDEVGVVGAVPSAILQPSLPHARIAGPALTVRNEEITGIDVKAAALGGKTQIALNKVHAMATPGDVLVIQGVLGVSSMGSLQASLGQRQGEIGMVTDGSTRDIEHSKGIGYPIWSRGVTPVTGKWRLRTAHINEPVEILGIKVAPGDLVLADAVGVCFIPAAQAEEVLKVALRIASAETKTSQQISSGHAVPDFSTRP